MITMRKISKSHRGWIFLLPTVSLEELCEGRQSISAGTAVSVISPQVKWKKIDEWMSII